MNLKIERVEVFGVGVPLNQGFKNAYSVKKIQRSAVLRLTASGGAVGLGNIDPSPGYSSDSVEDILSALEKKLAPAVIGLDPTNIHRLHEVIDRVAPHMYYAKAAVEMACVDLTARACGIPVHTYLGGAVKDKLTFNAWIGILTPEQAARDTLALKQKGFRSAKIKVGGGIEADRDRIKAVREAVGPEFKIRIDANCGYDADTSIKLAHMVLPYNLQLFEQPVPVDDIAGMARVRRESGGTPIMADESISDHASLISVIKAEAADIVKVKIMKQGGFLPTLRMIATAEAAGIRCVLGHGFGLGVNTTAEIMLAATQANVIDGLECVGPLKTTDDIITRRIDMSNGTLPLPQGLGLGCELDDEKLVKYRLQAEVTA
jgi:muconate cycloisomerase